MNYLEFDWKTIQRDYDESSSGYRKLMPKYGFNNTHMTLAVKDGLFKPRSKSEAASKCQRPRMSEDQKQKLSKIRKKFLKENPDKVPYVLNHKSKGDSYPEKYFSKIFKEKFTRKYRVLNYELDFADVENKIDIEIDGEQHFVDPRIVEHDKKRNQALRELGWIVIRIRWATYQSLSREEKEEVVNAILSYSNVELNGYMFLNEETNEEVLSNYYKKLKKKRNEKLRKCICSCGGEKNRYSKNCKECEAAGRSRFKTNEDITKLENLVQTMSVKEVGKIYGVSDTMIYRWCKRHGIERKDRRKT